MLIQWSDPLKWQKKTLYSLNSSPMNVCVSFLWWMKWLRSSILCGRSTFIHQFSQSHLIHLRCAHQHFDDSFSHLSLFIASHPFSFRMHRNSWQWSLNAPLVHSIHPLRLDTSLLISSGWKKKIIVTCTTKSKGFSLFVLQSSSNVKDWRQHDDGSNDVNGDSNESSFSVPLFFFKWSE